jgi:ParB family transcriptional regulator, chromosome partitioning protein
MSEATAAAVGGRGASRQRQRGEGRFPDGLGGSGRGPGPPVMENPTMAKAIQKIAMNAAENIPFDKLVLSQKNVRRVKDGASSSSPRTSAGESFYRA